MYKFPATSRYFNSDLVTMQGPDGRVIAYVRRRIVPQPERFALLQEHVAQQGERPDHVAAQYLGDPEQFWRIADANGVLRPEELTETAGRRIRITLPEGIPGIPNA
jgi:hypothetical protein